MALRLTTALKQFRQSAYHLLSKADIDSVELMVGMFVEDLPEGFGFSDTAFRIFINTLPAFLSLLNQNRQALRFINRKQLKADSVRQRKRSLWTL